MVGPLDIFTNSSAGGILHGDPLDLGPSTQSVLLRIGESQCHGHTGMIPI